jgi:ABC-type polysaccharide/polyol phosphate export permease
MKERGWGRIINIATAAAITAALLFIGIVMFKKVERTFMDTV